MQNKFLIMIPIFTMLGCAHNPTPAGINTVIQRVEVPIAVPCKVDVPVRPSLNFDKLVSTDNIFDKTKAILADRKLYIGYEAELLAAINSCVK